MQYPVRPVECSYEDEQFITTKVKPQQKKVSIEVALDTTSNSYLSSKGEHLAMSVDGPVPKGPPTYASGKLDRIELTSLEGMPKCDRYAIASVANGQLHLTPLSAIVQMRPDLGFLDKAEESSKLRAQLLELDEESSQDEEEKKMEPITKKYEKQETAEQKSRRMQSYGYMRLELDKEDWRKCTYHKTREELSARLRRRLLADSNESVDSYCTPTDYLDLLIPKSTADIGDEPDKPSNTLSSAQLKTMSLNDQVKNIVTNAKVIKWTQLIDLLDDEVDHSLVIKALQQVAVLVQGCWVVKSDILYPKDSFSAHSASPADVISRARDYMLWKFTQTRSLIRKEVSSVVKIPPDELKEMLSHIARPRVKQGWVFNLEYDFDFVNRNKDVVQRQQMMWDAKYQQLCKHFKLTKDGKPIEMSKSRRRRNSSKSKSRSDMSDTDGEKTPTLEQTKPAFAFPNDAHIKSSPTEAIVKNEGSDTDTLVRELSALLRDKLLVNSVLNMSDMRHMYQTKLAQCPPGHVLATGVSDTVLEKAILTCGAVKVHYMKPPGSTSTFYLLADTDDGLAPARKIFISLMQQSSRLRSNALKQELERCNIAIAEETVKHILKGYCVFRAGVWHLKGSIDN